MCIGPFIGVQISSTQYSLGPPGGGALLELKIHVGLVLWQSWDQYVSFISKFNLLAHIQIIKKEKISHIKETETKIFTKVKGWTH